MIMTKNDNDKNDTDRMIKTRMIMTRMITTRMIMTKMILKKNDNDKIWTAKNENDENESRVSMAEQAPIYYNQANSLDNTS